MYLSESLQTKWEGVLNHPDLAPITDPYKKAVTAVILENQYNEMSKDQSGSMQQLDEAAPANVAGSASNFDPILISLVRRSLPNLIAYDICGVQPMTGPTGLIFAMRSRYTSAAGAENFYNEVNPGFSGAGVAGSALQVSATAAAGGSDALTFTNNAAAGMAPTGMTTAQAEAGIAANTFAEMAFTIDKVTVTAVSRALKAEYSIELAQDLKAVHGLDAETELANILSAEILAEINREVVRTIYKTAKIGCQVGTTSAGNFDLDTDSNGRWMVEKIKGLAFQLEREANQIAKETRRGKGNFILVTSDVASALAMSGLLDYNPALLAQTNLTVDDTGNTYAGMLFGRIKVYIDPYAITSTTGKEFAVVGYKGSNAYDAGLFYCPYVPLQMVRAVDTGTFQPKIGFKTRYGMQSNPFAAGTGASANGVGAAVSNVYYRSFKVSNLM
jgi:hypothetical protein